LIDFTLPVPLWTNIGAPIQVDEERAGGTAHRVHLKAPRLLRSTKYLL
jgi:hypothetical protein